MLVFFDDILIYSKNEADHCEHLRIVLNVLKENQLYVNKGKCEVGVTTVAYLGHVISGEGVSMDMGKVSAVLSLQIPTSL